MHDLHLNIYFICMFYSRMAQGLPIVCRLFIRHCKFGTARKEVFGVHTLQYPEYDPAETGTV